MRRETDLPAWTIRIWWSNIKWNGKVRQNVAGDISGAAIKKNFFFRWWKLSHKALSIIFSPPFATKLHSSIDWSSSFVLVGLSRLVVFATSVIKNWMWSEISGDFPLPLVSGSGMLSRPTPPPHKSLLASKNRLSSSSFRLLRHELIVFGVCVDSDVADIDVDNAKTGESFFRFLQLSLET